MYFEEVGNEIAGYGEVPNPLDCVPEPGTCKALLNIFDNTTCVAKAMGSHIGKWSACVLKPLATLLPEVLVTTAMGTAIHEAIGGWCCGRKKPWHVHHQNISYCNPKYLWCHRVTYDEYMTLRKNDLRQRAATGWRGTVMSWVD